MGYAIRNGKYDLFFTLKNLEAEGVFFWGGAYLSWLILHPSEQCWASLQASSLNTLVQMLKTAIASHLFCWTETIQSPQC